MLMDKSWQRLRDDNGGMVDARVLKPQVNGIMCFVPSDIGSISRWVEMEVYSRLRACTWEGVNSSPNPSLPSIK